jgi:hypothetical protein
MMTLGGKKDIVDTGRDQTKAADRQGGRALALNVREPFRRARLLVSRPAKTG